MIEIAIVTIILILIIIGRKKSLFDTGCYTGKIYKIPCELTEDNDEAEAILKNIDNFIQKYIIFMKNKYLVNNNSINKSDLEGGNGDQNEVSNGKKRAIMRLAMMYKPNSLYETYPLNDLGDTSYTINTGELLSFCIRKWDNDMQKFMFHDRNTLIYVTVHELAHVAANEVAHPMRFWSAFKWLLKEAVNMGEYEPVDYRKYPVIYCKNLAIKSNILYDNMPEFH